MCKIIIVYIGKNEKRLHPKLILRQKIFQAQIQIQIKDLNLTVTHNLEI